MLNFITDWLPEILASLAGGGIVALFTIPEKKASARLDNAERVVLKYEEILKRYEKRISELEDEVKALKAENTMKEQRIDELENKLSAIEAKRNSRGQFIKRNSNGNQSDK